MVLVVYMDIFYILSLGFVSAYLDITAQLSCSLVTACVDVVDAAQGFLALSSPLPCMFNVYSFVVCFSYLTLSLYSSLSHSPLLPT